MMALATMMLASTSCQKEGMDEPGNSEYVNVTFTAQLPSGITQRAKTNGPRKAYSDGKSATELYYAVYEDGVADPKPLKLYADENADYGKATFDGNSLSTTVTLKLATDKKYDIVFFAKASNAPYTFSAAAHNFTIDYDKVNANDESLDAFYAKYDYDGTSTDNVVKLYRPFAQLNIGTSDLDDYNLSTPKLTATEVEVSANVGDALDLLSGKVANLTTRTFSMAAVPGSGETFPKEGYKYLSMNYLLVDTAKQVVDVTLKSDAKSPVGTYANVPVKRNYSTNIYGALLTEDGEFNVEIKPAYDQTSVGDFNYFVKTADEFTKAINAEGENLNIEVENNIADVGDIVIPAGKTVTVNLHQWSVTVDGSFDVLGSLTIKEGRITSLKDAGDAAIFTIESGSFFSMTNVQMKFPNTNGIFIKDAQHSTTHLTEVDIDALRYGLATDASSATTETTDKEVTLNKCVIKAATPVLFNVPSTINIKGKTELEGWWQAMILRGGTANVDESKFILKYDNEKAVKYGYVSSEAEALAIHTDGNWGSGNNVPVAAIVLGTNDATAYQYPTNLNMAWSTVSSALSFPAVYQSNAGGSNVVTYTAGSNNSITGNWVTYGN